MIDHVAERELYGTSMRRKYEHNVKNRERTLRRYVSPALWCKDGMQQEIVSLLNALPTEGFICRRECRIAAAVLARQSRILSSAGNVRRTRRNFRAGSVLR